MYRYVIDSICSTSLALTMLLAAMLSHPPGWTAFFLVLALLNVAAAVIGWHQVVVAQREQRAPRSAP